MTTTPNAANLRLIDFVELVGDYVTNPRDMVILANSVASLSNEITNQVVAGTEGAVHDYYRPILAANESELQSIYGELHALREENERLRVQSGVDRFARGTDATQKGILFALSDYTTLDRINQGKRIEAIKRVRSETTIGLKEAADTIKSAAVVEAARDRYNDLAEWERNLLDYK